MKNVKKQLSRFQIVAVSLAAAFLIISCRSSTQDDAASEILAVFDHYWESGEEAAAGRELLRSFGANPAYVLQALVIATPFQREQMLVLLGSGIARANREGSETANEFSAAIERAENMELDEQSLRMLGFIQANITHFNK